MVSTVRLALTSLRAACLRSCCDGLDEADCGLCVFSVDLLSAIYLLVQSECFSAANVYRMKSLDISFHRLQHGLAVSTRVFQGRVEGERLVEALQRLVASA